MLVAAAGNIVSRRPWYLGTAVISMPSQQEQCGGWGRCRRRGGKSQISHVVAKKSTDAAVLEEEDDDYQEELPDIQKASALEREEEEEQQERSFLKLSQARNWSLGIDSAAPSNASLQAQERENERADRRRQSLLEYDALKRNFSLTTIVVAGAVDAYCFLTLSLETTVSYAVGALGSYLYLQLLFRHADSLSEDNVADVFMRRKLKKIGIRSGDVKDSLEKTFYGIGMALSSPRLSIPAGLYTLWAFSAHYSETSSFTFHLQVVPLMLGFFAYKAAALIQAYRDNKDLLLIISKGNDDSNVQ
ncbi:unnamed protein product [Sphagnum troendelagicum]